MASFEQRITRIVMAGILGSGLIIAADLNGPPRPTGAVGDAAVEMAAVSTPQAGGTDASTPQDEGAGGQGSSAQGVSGQVAGGQSDGWHHRSGHRHHHHWWSMFSWSDSGGQIPATATSTPTTAAPLTSTYSSLAASAQPTWAASGLQEGSSSSASGADGSSSSSTGAGAATTGGVGTARALSLSAPSSSYSSTTGAAATGSSDPSDTATTSPSDTGTMGESTTPTTSASASDSSASALTADSVINADGTVNAAGYKTMAGELGSAAGVAYRFGPAATGSTSGRSTAYEPSTKSFTSTTSKGRVFEVGTQDPSKQDFSNDQGQVGYVPTGTGIGVDHVQTVNMDQNTIDEKPGLSWTYFGGGHPEPDFTDSQYSAGCVAKLGTTVGHFVAQARAYAHGESTANTLVAFDNGVIAAAGDNTARGHACLKLPANLHPSAISVTNGNEFALVTVWNTDTLKSELAVIALGGQQPQGTFWHNEWSELYPGLMNYGIPTFTKYLGTIPLPVAAATAVSAVSDNSMGQWLHTPGGQNVLRGDFPLSNDGNRQTFISGGNKDKVAHAGYAVITSRSEKKVVFVDLQPLFDMVNHAYFGDRSTFTSTVAGVGQGATQFPATFASSAAEKPVVVKTVAMAQAPTSVAAMLSGSKTPRAYVGTVDGKLHVFDVGGLASNASASASAITDAGSITVGKNPTNITYLKDRSTGNNGQPAVAGALDDTLIVTSRADREVQWVSLTGDSGSVVRTLADSRLVDPIAAEDNNNHGTESYVVSVADYGAGTLDNYRYGPAIFHTQGGASYGMGPSGNDKFEFGGSYNPGGKPFSISVTNVT